MRIWPIPIPALAIAFVCGAFSNPALSAMQTERVPDAAVVHGVPQGMFVGRSLLSGKAVCLLFLSGGRITRAIPEGGLESFDWNRHRAAHGPDSGSWQMRGSQLVVTWGDGGVHQGPITEHPDGIEFYGKRYAKPVPVSLSALTGRWESSRGTAIAGGAGINRATQLVITADGRYQWTSTTGGVVEGRAVANDRAMSGKVTVRGLTIILTSDAGATTSHTLLAAAGQPVTTFSVDSDMFTRSGAATAAPPAVPPSDAYQGLSFTMPAGWASAIQQGRFTVAPSKTPANANVVLFVYGAEQLTSTVDAWLAKKMTDDLAGMKVLQSTPATRAKAGGLDALSTGRTVQDQRGVVLVEIYYAITDGKRAGLAMAATANQDALTARMPAVQAFFQSLRFGGAAPPTAPSAKSSIAAADLVGSWNHSDAAHTVHRDSSTSTIAYGDGYTFKADSTFTYNFTGMYNGAYLKESDSGTWAVEGGRLVLRGRTRGAKTYQIVQFQTAGDGSTSMTLLLADYPATDSNINAWGEKYVRKGN